jgi:hypothetical protein
MGIVVYPFHLLTRCAFIYVDVLTQNYEMVIIQTTIQAVEIAPVSK